MKDISAIETLLEQKFVEPGFEDCFVVEALLLPGNKLEVFIDADSGITFEKCQKVSRYLEAAIDEAGWLGDDYTLEVSSPGLDRPLKLWRQYKKNAGRKVTITLKNPLPDGSQTIEGQLLRVEEGHISVEMLVKPEGKKKSVAAQVDIPFQEIKKTMVKVSW
jgi:ribosome maturation factor RimP